MFNSNDTCNHFAKQMTLKSNLPVIPLKHPGSTFAIEIKVAKK